MCQIVERVYTKANGQDVTHEYSYPCSRAPPGYLCNNIKKTRQYPPPLVSHDNGSSPISTAPSTPPTGTTGSYAVRTRRPSDAGRRLSVTERKIKPEIIITLGAHKEKKYVSSKSYKRSSLSGSIGSNDYPLESLGSDASYTVRTGLPEATIDTIEHANYSSRPILPNGQRGYYHTSAASSYTSIQTPSLVATSDLDTPATRQPRQPATIVHQHNLPHSAVSAHQSSSPTVPRTTVPSQSQPYRAKVVAPRASSSPDSLSAEAGSTINSNGDQDPSSSSPPPLPNRQTTTAAGTQRRSYSERVAVHHVDSDRRKRQESADLEMAKRIQKEADKKANKIDEAKHVRFERDRYDTRAEQREEARQKLKEQERQEQDRERRKLTELLQRQKEETAKEEQERERFKKETRRLEKETQRSEKDIIDQTKSRGRRDSRPPLSGSNTRSNRRHSISRADREERDRLRAHETATMKDERAAADQREREEIATTLIEQQQRPEYYDPRGGNRQVIATEGPAAGRRNSVSGKRPAVVNGPPAATLVRRESQRRGSVVVQNAPPNGLAPINTNMAPSQPQTTQGQYAARLSQSATRPSPPQFYNQLDSQPAYTSTRPNSSARHHSYVQDQDLNPFSQPPGRLLNTSHDNPYSQLPPARLSNTSQDPLNPFSPFSARHTPNVPSRDPWDGREAAQPPTMHARQLSDESQNALRHHGEDYLAMTTADGNTHTYDRARYATQSMHQAYHNGDR